MLLEQWNLVNKEHKYADRSMKQNVRAYFPSHNMEALLLVDWKTLKRIVNENYVNFYSIKPTVVQKSDTGNEGCYVVGLPNSEDTIKAIKKYKQIIAVKIKKDKKTLDKLRQLV